MEFVAEKSQRGCSNGNIDPKTVEGFGEEWTRFDQSTISAAEYSHNVNLYFNIFPWDVLPEGALGFDLGCGSGRWARWVAPRVGTLHCIDASEAALRVARRNLADELNCQFHLASVDRIPLEDGSMDFGYALGVLHHIPDTLGGIKACVRKLKPGAPFLVYLYYAFDNRPTWYRALWRASDLVRLIVSRLPHKPKYWLSTGLAALAYFPLARLARLLERLGWAVDLIPLSAYRSRSFYTMRTDALDRFGTRLEQRFTARQVLEMMEQSGLERIRLSNTTFWCAVGHKSDSTSGTAT